MPPARSPTTRRTAPLIAAFCTARTFAVRKHLLSLEDHERRRSRVSAAERLRPSGCCAERARRKTEHLGPRGRAARGWSTGRASLGRAGRRGFPVARARCLVVEETEVGRAQAAREAKEKEEPSAARPICRLA